MPIPPRLIQTARSHDLPPLAKAAAANLRLLHPDWEYLFFDDPAVERFITSEFPEYRSIYDGFPRRIQKFDFFRYLVVLRHGGFYFDLDVLLCEPLTPLLEHQAVFPFEELTLNRYLRRSCGIDWELGNYAFGAEPGNPFLAAVVENCVRAQRDPAWARPLLEGIPAPFRNDFNVLNTTGPGLVTRTFAEGDDGRTVTILSPGDVCDPRSWHRFGVYGLHLMEASWRGQRSFLARRIVLAWENSRRRRLLAESRALGPTRACIPSPA